MTSDAVPVGSAVIAYIEPHAGLAREFNAWYERDHFYAAAMAGPGMYAGARWVATKACKRVRPAGRLLGDPSRGSYLATYWVLPDMLTTWEEWVGAQYAAMPPERLFAGRDHVHTAIYEPSWDARTPAAPAPSTALDHGFAGVIVVAGTDRVELRSWADDVVFDAAPLALGFDSGRVIMTTADAPDHSYVLLFCAQDPLACWSALELPESAGFASPFLRTVPGTDRYVDDL